MSLLGIVFLVLALALTDAARFRPLANYWRGRVVAARLVRLVPIGTREPDTTENGADYLAIMYGALKALDPTLQSSERALRSLSVLSPPRLLAAEIAKILVSTLCAVACVRFFDAVALKWISPFVVFVMVLFGSTEAIKSVARARRRRILGELIFGAELITIFLEGGQSLDQALRSFCEVCGEALPSLEPVQRALVADLNNGMPYDKALERWAETLTIEQAWSLAALFVESLTHGTELAPQLRQFSLDLFEQRLMSARASIGAKSAQLTVILITFFLPAILAFVAAPAMISLFSGLESWK